MGSITGSVLSSCRAPTQGAVLSSRIRRVQPIVMDHARHPHHVENTRGEAKQQKYDHPPRRKPEPAVEQPADGGADQDAGDELGRQAKTAGDRRRIGGRTLPWFTVGRTVGMVLAEPFAESPQPRGERGLVGWWVIAISPVACVVGHAFDTRDFSGEIAAVPPPPRPRGPY